MPIARIEINGRVGRFEVPEGTSPEEARRIALESLPKPEYSVGEDVKRGLGLTARSVIQGVAALPAMVADIPVSAYNAITGRNLPATSHVIEQGLTNIGLPQPQTGMERFSVGAGEALTGLGAGIKGAQMVGQAASPIAQGVANVMASNVPQQAAAVTGGLAGQNIAQEMGAGPVGQAIGALAGSAVPSVATGAAQGLARAVTKPRLVEQATSEGVKAQANQLYRQAEQLGGTLKPAFTDEFINRVQKVTPQTTAGKIVGGKSAVTSLASRINNLKGRALSLAEAQDIDEALGDMVDGMTEMGRVTKDGRKVLQMQTEFRSMIENADEKMISGGKAGFEALREARKLWSRQLKLRDVERIIERAEMTDNPQTAIKTGFRTLYGNPKRMAGYNKEEQRLIRDAANSGFITDALRTIGSRLNPIAAGAVGGPVSGAAMQGISTAGRAAATGIQGRKAAKVLRAIGGDSNIYKDPTRLQAAVRDMMAAGTKFTNADITALPPKDAQNLIKAIRAVTAAKALTEE